MPAQSTLRRPAAVQMLKHGLGQDKDKEEDGETNDQELRNKAKSEKWSRARAANQIPEHVLWLYDVKAKETGQPREYRTQIVNKLFEKGPGGTFSMNLEDTMFKEAQTVYRRHYGKDEDIGMPKSLVKGLYFGNSDKAWLIDRKHCKPHACFLPRVEATF